MVKFKKDYNKLRSFRFNAEKVFLTYSQTRRNMTHQWLLDRLNAKSEVYEYLISQERHKGGGYHLHAYVHFHSTLDTKNVNYFDVVHYSTGYHPNIKKPDFSGNGRYRLYDYIKKDGNYITNLVETRPAWQAIKEDATSWPSAIEMLQEQIVSVKSGAGYQNMMKLLAMELGISWNTFMKDLESGNFGIEQKISEIVDKKLKEQRVTEIFGGRKK